MIEAHVHLGVGRLGCGLVIPTSNDAGVAVHAVTHAASTLPRGSALKVRIVSGGAVAEAAHLEVASLSHADTLDALSLEAAEVVESTKSLLITTALGTANLAAQRHLIRSIATARQGRAGFATTFIACENDVGETHPDFEQELRGLGVDCRRAVVDRVCIVRKEDKEAGAFVVRADETAEWVIEGEADNQVLAALAGIDHVTFVADITPYERRKLWLVNGAHLAVAVRAHQAGVELISVHAARLARRAWLDRFQAPIAQLLASEYPELPDYAGYGASRVDVMIRGDDEVIRILRRMNRADPTPFFRDLDLKVGVPARHVIAGGGTRSMELDQVLNDVHELLISLEEYMDVRDVTVDPTLLSQERDAKAVAAYGTFLTGVLSPAEVSARTSQLAEVYDMHYEELQRRDAANEPS